MLVVNVICLHDLTFKNSIFRRPATVASSLVRASCPVAEGTAVSPRPPSSSQGSAAFAHHSWAFEGQGEAAGKAGLLGLPWFVPERSPRATRPEFAPSSLGSSGALTVRPGSVPGQSLRRVHCGP